MFNKILIANRGEIACRIIQTCRELGIRTVAVYSEADARALHVIEADEAYPIGPAKAADSYLRGDKIIDAAKQAGAEAIHPGYGFLSENSGFARDCEKAGIVFIGPKADTIDAMGSKSAAKALMEKAGVPVVPGYHGDKQDEKTLTAEAERIGFPLMIKASAGGGGKGMRIVRSADEFADALSGARREAKAAFGDDKVLLERYIETPRHIEFQIFGDQDGNAVHLFERECSIQRRYQKVVEETPSPFLDETTRQKMAEAAILAAKAVDYVGAGTVEFIVGADKGFYFMEMNTRLQVEHPVTEGVTGEDLVEWQLSVAAGNPLPRAQEELEQGGHSIEVRLYAENPDKDFLPAVGTLGRFTYPEEDQFFRVDTGVRSGDEISIHYDPMIAKIVAWDEDRESCIHTLRAALADTAVFGLTTNLPLLRAILADDDFANGNFDTGFLDRKLDALLAFAPDASRHALLAAVASTHALRENPDDAWGLADGWQANRQGGARYKLTDAHGNEHNLTVRHQDEHWQVEQDGETVDAVVRQTGDGEWLVTCDNLSEEFRVIGHGPQMQVVNGVDAWRLTLEPLYAAAAGAGADEAHPGSPMPGRIVAVHVAEGDAVETGQALLVLEGMKMEYTLKAAIDGTVEKLLYGEGDMVDAEVPLVDIKPAE